MVNRPQMSQHEFFNGFLNHKFKFQVTNRGPSAISGATLDIVWPSYSETGKHLLYLIDQPFISDSTKAKCRVNQPQNLNSANLAVICWEFLIFFSQISNEHVPTIGPSGVHGISIEDGEEEEQHEEGEEEEEEVAETQAVQQPAGEEPPEDEESDEEEEEEFYGKRKKRQADDAAVRRNLRQQKQMLREAVDHAKEAGAATEYHGQLGRKTLVNIIHFFKFILH